MIHFQPNLHFVVKITFVKNRCDLTGKFWREKPRVNLLPVLLRAQFNRCDFTRKFWWQKPCVNLLPLRVAHAILSLYLTRKFWREKSRVNLLPVMFGARAI